MPPPKKAAKKAPAKSAHKHHEGKDMRRAYEHRGRLEALRSSLDADVRDIDTLVELAERELSGNHYKDAADLLRAAEHLSFGYLGSSKSTEKTSEALMQSIEEEFEHKLEKAEEHWEEPEALSSLYQGSLKEAHKAFKAKAYRRALELVRAAEALAHVHLHDAEES